MQESTTFQLIVLGYLERDGQVLLARRPAQVAQGNRWEFPGGKVEAGESLGAALQRELWEELGVTVAIGDKLAMTRYAYPDYRVELHLFHCWLTEGEPLPRQASAIRWVPAGVLRDYDFPPANESLLLALDRSA